VITYDDVLDAAERLRPIVRRTPVLECDIRGARVFCKAENLQVGGSFKIRGAYNAAAQLTLTERATGLVAISSGNHAQGVALAANLLGTTARIAMPLDAPPIKREATAALGAEIVLFDRHLRTREEVIEELMRDGGAFIPPFDHPDVMAGQGTAALELFEEVDALDALVVPVSGGGLIAGCGIVARAKNPAIRLIGVEPEAADDTKRSLEAGMRVTIPVPRTVADGLQVTTPGELTFAINRHQIDEVVTVSDDEIRDAMAFARRELDTVVEPSGAVGLAAVLEGRVAGVRRIGVILSGGNVDRRA
jgi:threo-3-hydroxy-L-aspartate ammonia-lyase